MILKMNFAKRVKAARLERGWKQVDLAAALKMRNYQPVNRWENAWSIPDSEVIEQMAEIFGVPPHWFFLPTESDQFIFRECHAIPEMLTAQSSCAQAA